eukprot:1155735-Pelagomonas_calceolata.AAC.18
MPAERSTHDKLFEATTISMPNSLEETTWADRKQQQAVSGSGTEGRSTDQGTADGSTRGLPMLDSSQGPSWGLSGRKPDPFGSASQEPLPGSEASQAHGGGSGAGEITTLVLEDDDEEVAGKGHQQGESPGHDRGPEGSDHNGAAGDDAGQGQEPRKHVVDDRVHAFSGSDADLDKLIEEDGKQGSS